MIFLWFQFWPQSEKEPTVLAYKGLSFSGFGGVHAEEMLMER